ncbi:MAG TPA: hypothetical protein VL098_02970 [Flavipsychrobacter sp.]|nr:hypothetical protein [Flavipsychrobacter sp.]
MKKWLLSFCFILITVVASYAQGCSVCTKTASELGDKSAKGLNNGILYLAAFPLLALGSIGFIWWKNYQRTKTS